MTYKMQTEIHLIDFAYWTFVTNLVIDKKLINA